MTLYTENPANIKSLELTHKFSRIAVFKQIEGDMQNQLHSYIPTISLNTNI